MKVSAAVLSLIDVSLVLVGASVSTDAPVGTAIGSRVGTGTHPDTRTPSAGTTRTAPRSSTDTVTRTVAGPAATAVRAAPGRTRTTTWRGIIPAGRGSFGRSKCRAGTRAVHKVFIPTRPALLRHHRTLASFSVNWFRSGRDELMYVTDAKGRILGTSDGFGARESVSLANLHRGTYRVVVCPSSTMSKRLRYRGRLTLRTTGVGNSFSDADRFTPATVVDPVLFGGEPGLTFDNPAPSAHRSFVDWPVSSRQNIGVLYRSTDDGLSYGKRFADYSSAAQDGPACVGRQVPFCASGGGGDTQVHVNPKNDILYFTSQESLANQAVGASFDHGNTFPTSNVDPVASQASGDVDRQWLASWEGTRTVFLAYHSPIVGEFIMRSDTAGTTGSWHNPSGANTPQIPGVTQSGAMFTDNTHSIHRHTIYVAYLGTIDGNFDVGVSTDGAKSFVSHPVPGSQNARNFTKITLDRSGNLYATWTDSETQKVYLSTSLATAKANRTAPATSWSKPVAISDRSQHVTIFPDVVAGSPGRIAIGYYGTTAKGPTPDDVKTGQGGWSPVMASSMNALCQWDAHPCARPSFVQSHIGHQINQDDNICTAGTTCAATMGNRNLLDYFTPSLDARGHVGFVWSDGTNLTKLPFVKVSRQSSGPSLYRGIPAVVRNQRGNGYPDQPGDALYPIAGNQIKTAHNHPALDLVGTATVPTYKNGRLVFRIRLANIKGLAAAVPGGGSTSAGATPLQQAKYVVRWDYHGNSYYVGANLAAGSSKPTYFSGTVNMTEGLLAAGATTPYGNVYSAQTPASGSVRKGYLQLSVPMSAVGRPRPGQTLVSVGSYALLGPVDSAATLNTVPITVDSTPTFDYRLPAPPRGVKVRPGLTVAPALATDPSRSWWAGGIPDLARLAAGLTRVDRAIVPAPASTLAGNDR